MFFRIYSKQPKAAKLAALGEILLFKINLEKFRPFLLKSGTFLSRKKDKCRSSLSFLFLPYLS